MADGKRQAFLFFPTLHPSLLATPLPSGVRTLDPGLASSEDTRFWRPSNLVLGPERAQKVLDRLLVYGEQFSPQDLAILSLSELGSQGPRSSMAIQGDLRRMLDGKADDARSKLERVRLQAQLVLILAWALEERHLELARLNRDVAESWSRLSRSIGPDPGPKAAMADPLSRPVLDDMYSGPSWQRLLLPFHLFLPPASCLVLADSELFAEFEEQGLEFSAPAYSFPNACYARLNVPELVSTQDWRRVEGLVDRKRGAVFLRSEGAQGG